MLPEQIHDAAREVLGVGLELHAGGVRSAQDSTGSLPFIAQHAKSLHSRGVHP